MHDARTRPCCVPFPDLTVISKRDLDPAGKCLEVLADLGRPGCIQLVNTCVLELQLQPHPVVRVPAERRAEDPLKAAIDAARDALRIYVPARLDIASVEAQTWRR